MCGPMVSVMFLVWAPGGEGWGMCLLVLGCQAVFSREPAKIQENQEKYCLKPSAVGQRHQDPQRAKTLRLHAGCWR